VAADAEKVREIQRMVTGLYVGVVIMGTPALKER